MNNKNCSCQSGSGFVPVNGNWDFNMEGCPRRNRVNSCERTATVCARAVREEVCRGCGRAASDCTCAQTACAAPCPAAETAAACVMKTAETACTAKKGVGMVRVTKQALGDIYDSSRALKAGTLFPELHKPMNGYWPCGNEAGTDCQQAAFAAWDLRLYLDTHPDDAQALALMRQLTGDCCEPNYAATFLPGDCTAWTWTDDPWPWSITAQGRR